MNSVTTLFHWSLNNPVIVASGPFSRDANSINKMLDYGAAAVVTKTITNIRTDNKGVINCKEFTFNREGYSVDTLADWDRYLEQLRNKKVIANIFAKTSDEITELARFVVNRGIEVIELGLSCPTFGGDPVCFQLSILIEFCQKVRKAVSVPIIVKLLLSTSKEYNRNVMRELKRIGIDAVSLSDSLPAIILDETKGKMKLGGTGGITGPLLKPLVLKVLYDIRDIGIPMIGIGGIETAQDVLEYLSMGATAVQVCSVLLKRKDSYLNTLITDLKVITEQER